MKRALITGLSAIVLAFGSSPAFADGTAAQVVPGYLTMTPQPNCPLGPCFVGASPATPLPVTSGGGPGGGSVTAAAGAYATGSIVDLGSYGSMTPYQGSGTPNVINLLGGIEADARGPLAAQAGAGVDIGGVDQIGAPWAFNLTQIGGTAVGVANPLPIEFGTGVTLPAFASTPTMNAAQSGTWEVSADQGTAAAASGAWPFYQTVGGSAVALSNPLPIEFGTGATLPAFASPPAVTVSGVATAANQEVTVAGTSATSAQAIQGVSGGVAVPVVLASNQTAADPCMFQMKSNAAFSSASGTFAIGPAGSGALKIYVCSILLIAPTAVSVSLAEGSSSTCGTSSQAAVIGVATTGTASNGVPFAANGGFTLGNGGGTVARTATGGDYLCVFQSGTAQIAGNLTYVQQ